MFTNSMCKKSLCILIVFYFFFYILNYLAPMSFGDDYVYSFIWEGHAMYTPMSENVERISSFRDLFTSQWSHYYTGNGRAVSHTIAQFFLWMGKDAFNYFNAFISVLLIIEIYWAANKGKVTFDFLPERLCWAFFMLWAFSPGFSPVFFWLTGACNYLWTGVFLLGFLLPYIHKYYFFEEKLAKNSLFSFVIFISGIIAGWSNENSICWVILILAAFIYANKERKSMETWLYVGLAGLVIGYALLMFAPGNFARLHTEVGTSVSWFTFRGFKDKLTMWAMVFFFQFLLWYFGLRSLFLLQKKVGVNAEVSKERLLVKTLFLVAFSMTTMMLLSPSFPPRSSFPGTIQLIIGVCILLRVQAEYDIELIKTSATKFLSVVAVIYSAVTISFTLYGFYDYHMQIEELLSFVKRSEQAKVDVITVHPLRPVSERVANASGFHMPYYEMDKDEKDWRNVAFARYYGIKGIRMVKEEEERKE